ncbi:MAG: hypothetical protein AAGI46_03660 [Planctomycetota bacterium]
MTPRACLAALVVVFGFSAPTFAQPEPTLADKVPAGSLFYLGWNGIDDVENRYGGTRTQALLAKSGLSETFDEYLPELLDALAREEPEAAPWVDLAKNIGGVVWDRPTVLSFGGIDFESPLNDGDPLPRIIFICDAGDRAGELRASLTGFLTRIEQPELVTLVREQDGMVYMVLGYDDLDLANLAAGGAGSLAASDAFTDGMAKLSGGFSQGTVLSLFLDVPAVVTMIGDALELDGRPEDRAQFDKGMASLGLNGLGVVTGAAGFDGGDFVQSSFLGLTGERQGLLRLLPAVGEGIDPELLANIPADATMMLAGRVELDELLTVVRGVANDFDPEAVGQLEQGLAFANMFAGADIEQDVLGQLSGTWAGFVAPTTGPDLLTGVLLQKPSDPDKLRAALRGMSLNLSSIGNAQLRKETDGLVTIPTRSMTRDGVEYYFANTPLLAPTWAVTDDVLVTAFNPQTAMAAVQFGGGFENSNVVRRLADLAGGNTPVFASYADLPTMTPHTYPALLLLMQGGVGAGDLFGEYLRTRPPGFVMPTLPDVQSNVTPSMAVAWMDEDGLHSRSVEPFPLSSVLVDYGKSYATLNQIATQVGVVAGTMVPTVGRARESAQKVKSASNMRQIGVGMMLYSIEDVRTGGFPDSLGELETFGLSGAAFVTPTDEPANVPAEPTAQWIEQESDYLYLGSGLANTAGPSIMVAIEHPDTVPWADGYNVLYADGAVRFVTWFDIQDNWQTHVSHRVEKGAPMDESTRAEVERLFGF